MPSLEASGLDYSYDGLVRVLAGVTLRLAGGEWVAVIGPNGSGKSTLLRLLAGLAEPAAGSVTLDGRPVARLSARERARRVALLPQSLATVPEVRVRDFVLAGRYAHVASFGALGASDREVVGSALERCDMAGFAERGLRELSGGQRQRVLIARALAQEAALLLVDEPTTALDPEHQIAIFELLAALARSGSGVAVATHDLALAAQYATRCLLMDQGRILRDGPPAEVLVPEVLAPVYGEDLHYGRWEPAGGETVARPLVLPRRRK